MKPSDLKIISFSQDSAIHDRVLYLGRFQAGFEFPGWNHASLFGNSVPISIEFCSGNGDWVVSRALQEPQKNWLGVELKFDRIRKIWSKIKNNNLSNLIVAWCEAFALTKNYIPADFAEEIYINFPDPWPKRRHEKHRLMRKEFIAEVYRILIKGKKVIFVTDDESYLHSTVKLFSQAPGFTPIYPAPFFVTEFEDYGTSWFETFWKGKGKTIYYAQFAKR